MENLQGKSANKGLNKADLTKIGDLLYFEGSLITLFKNQKNGHLYLFDWADSDNIYNRWLVYEVQPIDILSYINTELTHLNLIKKGTNFCCIDIDKKSVFCNVQCLPFSLIPLSYLPNEDCIFDVMDCPDFKKIQSFLDKILVLQTA